MKKLITIPLLLVIACSKPSAGPAAKSTATPVLNATESTLVGTWYLRVLSDSITINGVDTLQLSTTGYTTAAYVEFKESASDGVLNLSADYKDCTDGFVLSNFGTNVGAGSTGTYWQYNEGPGLLIVSGFNYSILYQSADTLVVQHQMPQYQYNKRRTFLFSH